MNFAVIGTFWLTENMIEAMGQTDKIRYFAQYSRSMERAKEFAEKQGHGEYVRLYDDLNALAADPDIDAVYIASPNYAHYEQARLMLEAGKSVLCEKPVCYRLSEYKELCELADRKGIVFMEAIMNIHLPWANDLCREVKNHGKVISARLDFSQRSSKLDRVKTGQFFSTFEKSTGGGALMDLGVYAVYLAIFLFGMPKQIRSDARFFRTGVDIQDVVLFVYDDFTAVLTFTKLVESRIHSEILCENGSVTIQNLSRLQNVYSYPSDGSEHCLHRETTFPQGMCCELSDFLSCRQEAGREGYRRSRELAEMVLRCMEEIRRQIGYNL
ncbi:MAG: Gfo/Idh/MocA family protein [Eubacteriales bacterium]